MKAIILAAGYATRLWPLTKDKPKPLLDVKGKAIIEQILKKIGSFKEIDEVIVVTNEKFFRNFLEWKASLDSGKRITLVNDKTLSNEDRLGSLGDIKYVIENLNIHSDIMIIAGDNLFEFSLLPLMQLYSLKRKPVIALYDVKDIELARHYGIVTVDENNKIISFEEKPKNPKSTLSSTGIYIYPEQILKKLINFVNRHGKKDKIGDFLEWLYKQEEIYCFITQEKWFDIGTMDQLEKARKEFNA